MPSSMSKTERTEDIALSDSFDNLMKKGGPTPQGRRAQEKSRGIKRFLLILMIVLCTAALLVSAAAVWGYTLSVNGRNLPNLYLDGVYVGNMTREETAAALSNARWDALEGERLTVSLPAGARFTVDFLRSGAVVSREQAVDIACAYGHDGSVFQNLGAYLKSHLQPVDVMQGENRLDESYIRGCMDEGAKQLNENLNRGPFAIDVAGEKMTMTKGAGGVELDRDALYEAVAAALRAGEKSMSFDKLSRGPVIPDFEKLYQDFCIDPINAHYTETFEVVPEVTGCHFGVEEAVDLWNKAELGEQVIVPLTLTQPEYTAEQLSSLLYCNLLGTQLTYYYGSTNERINNIRLAASKLDGLILLPGEVFSYNDTVGKRTEEAGFQYADAYSDGQVVSELGGGICQVSSTLYSATLYARLKILSRTNHYFKVGYIDYGMDATVSWGQPDFKFRNDFDWPIKLAAYLNEDEQSLVVEVWGTDVDGITVKIWHTEDPVYDEELPYIQTGWSIHTYGDLYDADGNFLRTVSENYGTYYFHDEDIDWPEGYERNREDAYLGGV